ncbi:hypothetical protein J6590_011574 [Homalodisca vitripennis]|nr:hypothetical protein J6590_011574 [Homalodisca vitripennis]
MCVLKVELLGRWKIYWEIKCKRACHTARCGRGVAGRERETGVREGVKSSHSPTDSAVVSSVQSPHHTIQRIRGGRLFDLRKRVGALITAMLPPLALIVDNRCIIVRKLITRIGRRQRARPRHLPSLKTNLSTLLAVCRFLSG